MMKGLPALTFFGLGQLSEKEGGVSSDGLWPATGKEPGVREAFEVARDERAFSAPSLSSVPSLRANACQAFPLAVNVGYSLSLLSLLSVPILERKGLPVSAF